MQTNAPPLKRTLWAIADLHLSLANPEKDMGAFGPPWVGYLEKIATRWRERVQPQDIVAVAGDISWAMRLEEALVDLQWLDALPGTKVLLKGNHDYWWSSATKLARALPPTCRALCGPALQIGSLAFAGTRLWETQELPYCEILPKVTSTKGSDKEDSDIGAVREQIFEREVQRLLRSLRSLPQGATTRIALTHFPPIGWQLHPTRVSRYLKEFNVSCVLFGHLHGVRAPEPLFGTRDGVTYALTAADYLDFAPKRILDFE